MGLFRLFDILWETAMTGIDLDQDRSIPPPRSCSSVKKRKLLVVHPSGLPNALGSQRLSRSAKSTSGSRPFRVCRVFQAWRWRVARMSIFAPVENGASAFRSAQGCDSTKRAFPFAGHGHSSGRRSIGTLRPRGHPSQNGSERRPGSRNGDRIRSIFSEGARPLHR